MKKLLTIALACVLLLSVLPAFAQTVAPGGTTTVSFDFSGANLNLLDAKYTVADGLTVTGGKVDAMYGGKAGKARALFVAIPAVSGGTLVLNVTAADTATGDLTITVTELRGYTPASGWVNLAGAGARTVKVSAGSGELSPDVNGDGKVSLLDVMTVLRAYMKDAAVDASKCDLNGDGKVSLLDVMAALRAYMGL